MLKQKDIDVLHFILKSSSDNQLKHKLVDKLMKKRKAKFIGLGTNRVTYVPNDNRNIIIKIALDEFGIEDNLNDALYSKTVPMYNEVFETHFSGIYSIQRRCKGFEDIADILPYYPTIMGTLSKLKKQYLLIDLSPRNIRNYGLYKKELRIIDGSDLIPIEYAKPLLCDGMVYDKKRRRAICNHVLDYDEYFNELVCPYCGKHYNPVLFKKKSKGVNVMKDKNFTTGLTDEEVRAITELVIRNRSSENMDEIEDDDDDIVDIDINEETDDIIDEEEMVEEEEDNILYSTNDLQDEIDTDEFDRDFDDDDDDDDTYESRGNIVAKKH